MCCYKALFSKTFLHLSNNIVIVSSSDISCFSRSILTYFRGNEIGFNFDCKDGVIYSPYTRMQMDLGLSSTAKDNCVLPLTGNAERLESIIACCHFGSM